MLGDGHKMAYNILNIFCLSHTLLFILILMIFDYCICFSIVVHDIARDPRGSGSQEGGAAAKITH